MITSESEYLICLLRSELHGEAPQEKPDEISWESVLSLASKHEVAPLAYLAAMRLSAKPEGEILKQWQDKYYQSISRNAIQLQARKTIADALHAGGIYTIEVQGTAVKPYYPAPNLRLMSDIDFIIPVEKIPEAEEIMRSLGYEVTNPLGREIHGKKGRVFVELHTEFFDQDNMIYPVLNAPYQYAELKDGFTAEVSSTIFYAFNLLHCLKHYHYSGLGISRVLDIYFLKKALYDSVDNGFIDKLLAEHGLKDDMDNLYALSDYWFNGIEPGRDISVLCAEVIEANRHGTAEIMLRRELEHDRDRGKHFVKLRSSLRRIFAPKSDIYDAYPKLKEHNVPLFFCWIYRAFSVVFTKRKFAMFVSFIQRLIKSK